MKNREAPEFPIHARVAGKLSDIQGIFHRSSMYLLYAVFHEIIGLSIEIHKDIRCILTTTQNFILAEKLWRRIIIFLLLALDLFPTRLAYSYDISKPTVSERAIETSCLVLWRVSSGWSRRHKRFCVCVSGSDHIAAPYNSIWIICLSNNDRASFVPNCSENRSWHLSCL